MGLKSVQERISKVSEIQNSAGNWDVDDYMRGMANGLILAEHIAYNRDGTPPYREPLPLHAYEIGSGKLSFLYKIKQRESGCFVH